MLYKLVASKEFQQQHTVILNPLLAIRHRRNVNPLDLTADYFNSSTVTTQMMSSTVHATSATNYSTVGAADVTSSSRDVTSTSQHTFTTAPSVQALTENSSSVYVKTVSFSHVFCFRFIVI